jgi:hypothetical protein
MRLYSLSYLKGAVMIKFQNLLASIVLFGFISIIFTQEVKADENLIKFKWAVYYDNGNQKAQNISHKRKQVLKKNDRIQFYIKAETDLVVYLFYIAPDGKVSTLLSDKLETPKEYIFRPDAQNWYEFEDNLGVEKFTLIVSNKPIKSIDEILTNLRADTRKYSHKLIDEIKRQQRQHSSLASEEIRAIEIAGVTRGGETSRQKVQLIERNNFYTKTYRFEHQQ